KSEEIKRLEKTVVHPQQAAELLQKKCAGEMGTACYAAALLKRPQLSYEDITEIIGKNDEVNVFIAQRIEAEIKYEGYIKRQ
ncbi:MAG: tRNA uridine-5-carboxymethylaminomethyl(34) synthesis enzyme MnmG, partial [Oscillospiraceae bacterium]